MIASFILGLSLSSGVSIASPISQPQRRADLPKFDPAALRRQQLQSVQRSRKTVEVNIELFERLLGSPGLLRPARAAEVRDALEKLRGHLEWLKEYEQELLDEDDPNRTPPAPMPRARPLPMAPPPREKRID